MWKSLCEYAGLVRHYWWYMLISVIAAVVGFGSEFGDSTGIIIFSVSQLWARILWGIAIVAIALIAPFLAFNKVRKERDEARALLQEQNSRRRMFVSIEGTQNDTPKPPEA